MSRVVRLVLFAGALTAGSWLGLGSPSADQARALAGRARVSAESLARQRLFPEGPRGDEGKADSEGAGGAPKGLDEACAPPRPDLGDVASMRPWPDLNAAASVQKAWMVAEGPAYTKGSGRRLVTLTFDDGPFPETTPAVLKELAKRELHASFFVIGRYLDGDDVRAQASRETLKQVAAAGHLIGNHTHDHVSLTSVTHTQVLEQIDEGARSIERVIGKRPLLFRPPFGKLDAFGEGAVRERGLDLVLWSVEKQDMRRADSHEVFRELVNQIDYKEGGVVLLHDIRWTSVAVLRDLLDWLHVHRWDPAHPARLGYEIVDLPTYLREVAAAPLPYASRDALERARDLSPHASPPRRPATVSRRRPRTGDGATEL
jgi:peptidoglycan/xylan/chitin deacetylase (PgdA/CDA1 family)